MTRQEAIECREQYNKEILFELIKYLDANPEIRFGQALINLHILEIDEKRSTLLSGPMYKDPFNDESVTIYNRMIKFPTDKLKS